MKAARRHHSGITLTETIVSASLMATIFLAVLYLYPSSMFAIHKGHDLMAASNCAQRAIERIRAQAFAAVPEGTHAETVVEDGTAFIVTSVVSHPSPRLKRIRVTAAPKDPRPEITASVTFETIQYDFTNP